MEWGNKEVRGKKETFLGHVKGICMHTSFEYLLFLNEGNQEFSSFN